VNEATGSALRRTLPAPLRRLVSDVVRAAEELDVAIGLVGGPVRDWLLERPIRDIDLVAAPPEGKSKPGAAEVGRALRGAGTRVVVHSAFGTIRIEREDAALDLATMRSESYAKPGALPTVSAGTLQQDLERRDFTVNALWMPMGRKARNRWPSIVDPSRGREDLAAGVLRTFHDHSFHDDPTRALRAARFSTRLGFRLARSSRTALRDAIRDGAFGAVAASRYRAEFEKLFAETAHGGDPVRALRWLSDAHVLGALEPGLSLPAACAAPLRRWSRDQRISEGAWVCGFMLWFAPLPVATRRRALDRFAITGRDAERIHGFPKLRSRVERALGKARGRGAIDAILAPLGEVEIEAVAASVAAPLRRKIQRHQREDRDVALPITGDALIELGLRGPAVGRALAQIRLAVLDRVVVTEADALALAREIDRPLRRKRGERATR
jgi:tRNA nucleotidyltransferase (CCA-adding enzyme)